eukprot:m.377763 g.377763  ORF g.377763 m.377763 type:complete len:81 (+) comp20926_c2_seq20:1335-1577(+)
MNVSRRRVQPVLCLSLFVIFVCPLLCDCVYRPAMMVSVWAVYHTMYAGAMRPTHLFNAASFEGNNPDLQMLTHTMAFAFN